jgi:UDP-sulfoquinovose synthase
MYEYGRKKLAEAKDLCEELWPSCGYELMVANGTSQTINLMALAMLRAFSKERKGRYKVITTTHEHPGGIGVFEQMPEYQVFYIEDQILRDEKRLKEVVRLLQPDVAFISHVFYSTGNFAPVDSWCNAVRDLVPGCKIILDVTQSLGLYELPFGVADALIGSTHKWLFGPHGSGVTWLKPEFYQWLSGLHWNGNAITNRPGGDNFCLQGGQDFVMYAELVEALKLYRQVGKNAVLARSAALSGIFRRKLEAVLEKYGIRYTILNKTEDAPLLSVALHEYNPFQLYSTLNEKGIHCKCMIDHTMGDSSYHILRFGMPYFETADRLNYVIDELQKHLAIPKKVYAANGKLSTAA